MGQSERYTGLASTDDNTRQRGRAGHLIRPFESNPLVVTKNLPNICLCTWAYAPRLGGKETPWVLKFQWRLCPLFDRHASAIDG